MKSPITWIFGLLTVAFISASVRAGTPVALDQLISTNGNLTLGDKKFSNFGFRGDIAKINPANILVEVTETAGCVTGLRFTGTMVTMGTLDFGLLYSVETISGLPLINQIGQSFMLSATGAGGYIVIGETVWKTGFFAGGLVAQSSIGFADFIDPPGEPVNGDILLVDPPLNKVWVTKNVGLHANDAQASVGLTEIVQTFCQNTTPSITCPPDITIQCLPVPDPDFTGGTVSGNCEMVTSSDGPLVGDSCDGTITRTWTALDGCGHTATCTQIIWVKDTMPPVLTKTAIANCYQDEDAAKDAAIAATSATDNCGGMVALSATIDGTCNAVVTVTGLDSCNNPASVTYNTHIDNAAPVLTACPDDILIDIPFTEPCEDGVAVVFVPPDAMDNCDAVSVICRTNGVVITSPTVFFSGATIVICTGTDICGNSDSCSFKVDITCQSPPPASIGDFVWCDLNANGKQDGGAEVGVPGVTVKLYTCGDVFVASTTTDANGLYGFSVPPGSYYVEFSNLPAGFTFSPQNAAGTTTANDSDANTTTGRTICTTLSPGEHDPTWDAGLLKPIQLVCASSSGQVGMSYASALVASGGLPPYTYSIIGALPPGLFLNPATGAITGTPTTAGDFAFTAQVVDSSGTVAGTETENCVITVIAVGGCRVTGGSNHQRNSYQSQCITTPLPSHISHGGQVGAPHSGETPFSPNSPCISGEWQHNRHKKGNSLVGNFHASGNGNQHQFDSLLCACLPCPENPNAVGVVGGWCNPGDRICGPEPRKAPANKICFSGVGDYTFTTGNKTVKAVFRVDIEDRSEGNSHSSSAPPDRYRMRLWILDPSCGRNPDPDSAEAMALRFAASADPDKIAVLATTEDLKVNIAPDIDDGGDMTQGNHQMHPATGSQCDAIVPMPAARLDVATEISCLMPGGNCTFGKVGKGYQGTQDPAFVYRVTITNAGTVTLTNLTVVETTGDAMMDTTSLFMAPGSSLPPGGKLTRYWTNTSSADTIHMAKVSGNSAESGDGVVAGSTAMACVGATEVTCTVTLSSALDQDGNPTDSHLKLPQNGTSLVKMYIQVCNTGDADLTGVTVSDSLLNCVVPVFDLAKGACTNFVCASTMGCPGTPIISQVDVTGKVSPNCPLAASALNGTGITVTTNASATVDGCVAPATVCGAVLRDCDANGNLTGEQGLAGWSVALKDSGGLLVASKTTDAGGGYCFTNLAPANYTVVVTPAGNYQQTSDPDGTKDNQTGASLVAGQSRTSVNFGYAGAAPSVRLVKSGPATAKIGDRVTYRFAVTNTGNTCLSGMSVIDPLMGGPIWSKTSVRPGEGFAFTTNYTIRINAQSRLTNTASVVGFPSGGTPVTNKSTWVIQVSNGLLSPWQTRDVGTCLVPGGATYSNNTYTVAGSGADIGGSQDSFRYLYQAANGDCTIVAKVLSMQNTSPQAKAGVMIRETLADNSKYAGIFLQPTAGVVFQSRTSVGGTTSKKTTAGPVAPYWVKLVRTGSTVTAYYSLTGQNNKWTSMGSVTVAMGSTVYIGLGANSQVANTLGSARFGNVTATP